MWLGIIQSVKGLIKIKKNASSSYLPACMSWDFGLLLFLNWPWIPGLKLHHLVPRLSWVADHGTPCSPLSVSQSPCSSLIWKVPDQFNSVAQLCPTLCNPMDCSTPGLPVHHQIPEFTHWVGDAIQPSHPLPSSSPPAFNLSQHHGLFKWVSSSHQVAKLLEFQFQHQSFQWIFRTDFLWNGLVWISLLTKGLSRVFSNTTVQKHQFFGSQLSFTVQLSYSYMVIEKKHSFD